MIRHLFAYGTLRPGLAPPAIASAVAQLRPLGEGFAFGRLYDLGKFPGAAFDPSSASRIYGAVFEIPQNPEILPRLDAYEGSDFVRTEQLVTLATGGVLPCWAYHYQGKPGSDCFVETGRWIK